MCKKRKFQRPESKIPVEKCVLDSDSEQRIKAWGIHKLNDKRERGNLIQIKVLNNIKNQLLEINYNKLNCVVIFTCYF